MQDAYSDPAPSADKAIGEIERSNAWTAFAKWLRMQQPVDSWDAFADLWNHYKEQMSETQPSKGRSGNYTTGSGAHVSETPESLHLQPKAKAKARAKAKGGSRPRARKIELTRPVLPYHDIMNDGYYVK